MSRCTTMRIIYNFLGITTIDCMYAERLMCLIRNFDCMYEERLMCLIRNCDCMHEERLMF